MKARIREQALKLGFNVCGFTSATKPDSAPQYLEWLALGYHADMAWLGRNQEKRTTPACLLPRARSVICVGVYYQARDYPTLRLIDHQCGQIAAYAQYPDYHRLMQQPLDALAEYLQHLCAQPVQSKTHIDTGPVLERALAQRAGVGFIGKHTNLVNRSYGNWLLLGEIITTLELPPDQPEKNRCGTCIRCLQACPTGALTSPFRLDSRRCISYLTIEHKGPIPIEMRSLIGTRIFGCDACIEVCPWNRFSLTAAPIPDNSILSATQNPGQYELMQLLQLEPQDFKRIFTGTPLERLKYPRFMRNVCVAAGNSERRDLTPVLKQREKNMDPLIAEHAAWALSQLSAL